MWPIENINFGEETHDDVNDQPQTKIQESNEDIYTVFRANDFFVHNCTLKESTIDGNIEESSTTVITAFYMIRNKHKSFHSWIQNFMSMDFKVIIFGDKLSLHYLRKHWPDTNRRLYIQREIREFVTSNWSWDDEVKKDEFFYIGRNAKLYQVYNEKIFMVNDVISMDPFSTEVFMWIDIGAFRMNFILPWIRDFPNNRKLNLNVVSFLNIEPFSNAELKEIETIDERFNKANHISGGHFAGE